MYCIRETNKSYTDKFNSKYTLVFSTWNDMPANFNSKYLDPNKNATIVFKLKNNETLNYIELPLHIQSLLQPLIQETLDYKYFIEYKSKEYIKIELAINLIKLMINF